MVFIKNDKRVQKFIEEVTKFDLKVGSVELTTIQLNYQFFLELIDNNDIEYIELIQHENWYEWKINKAR